MTEKKNQLREDSISFALNISDLCETIKGFSVYTNQLLRSSSSVGANIFEARYAQSNADFISKLEIALKECSESEFWLELMFRKGLLSDDCHQKLKAQCGSIRRRLIASVTTVKNKENS